MITSHKPNQYNYPHSLESLYIIMFSYLSDTELISRLACKIIQPKQAYYNQDPIYLALSCMRNIAHVDSAVFNKYDERLKVSLFYDKTAKQREVCVVFMHGYGSNRVQAVSILPHLPKQYSLCCFDFSAEGKSDGEIVTFGEKQKYDIRAIVNYLKTCGYKKFVLWGRSMGATCTLLYTQKQKPEGVFLQILDSPFASFEQAALQLTRKRAKIPQIILKMALDAVKQNIAKKSYTFNPFEVNLNQKPIYCDIPTIFIYSEEDDIVNPENSHRLIKNFQGHYEKCVIHEHHNSIRNPKTLKEIVNLIKKYQMKKIKPQRVTHTQDKETRKSKNKANCVNVFSSKNHGMTMSTGSTSLNTCPSPKNKSKIQKLHSSINIERKHRGQKRIETQDYGETHEFDNYGFIQQCNVKMVAPNKNNHYRKDRFKPKDLKQLISSKDREKRRPKSSLKVYSAEISKDAINGNTTPINLRGSHAMKSSQSGTKVHALKSSFPNDFYF